MSSISTPSLGAPALAGERHPLMRRAFAASAGKVFWDVLSRSLAFLASILIARRLGAAGFGSYAVLWYLAWLLTQMTDLGLHLVILRSLARSFRREALWSAVTAKLALTVLVVVGLGAARAGALLPARHFLVLCLLASVTLVGSWTEFFGVVLRSRGKLALEGVVLTLLRAGWLVAASVALLSGTDLVRLASYLAAAGVPAFLVGLAWVLREARRQRPVAAGGSGEPQAKEAAFELVRQAAPLAFTTVVTLLYLRADLFILASLRGAEEVGLFAASFRLFEAMFVFSGGIVAGSFPLLASRFGRRDLAELSAFVLRLLLGVGLPAAIGLWLVAEPMLHFLFGPSYTEASEPLRFLAVALVAVFVNALTTHLLIASHRGRYLVGATLIRLLVAIAVDLALIPRFGAVGAAAAVAVAEWSLVCVSLVAVRDVLPARQVLRVALPLGACALVMGVAVSHSPDALAWQLATGFIVYGLLIAGSWQWSAHRRQETTRPVGGVVEL